MEVAGDVVSKARVLGSEVAIRRCNAWRDLVGVRVGVRARVRLRLRLRLRLSVPATPGATCP